MASRPTVAPSAHRFTRDEYHRMAEAGLFRDERVELLDSEIITMSPKSSGHAFAVSRLMQLLVRKLGSTAIVRIQDPIVLDDWSEPEPDVAVCDLVRDDYRHAHPRADQIRLVIEVAESSLAYDRTRKARAYATAEIPEYWIVDLVDRRVEILSGLDRETQCYRECRNALPGDSLPLGSEVIAVDL